MRCRSRQASRPSPRSAQAPTGQLPPTCEEGTGLTFSKDIWFSYTASVSGPVRVTTCIDATFNTRLAVYAGAQCPPTALLACNDVDPSCSLGPFSTVEFNAVCGESYLVRVGGRQNASGSGLLSLVELGQDACPCPADLNGDLIVNGADLAILLGNWGAAGEGDLNDDGVVNGADIAILLGAWGPC